MPFWGKKGKKKNNNAPNKKDAAVYAITDDIVDEDLANENHPDEVCSLFNDDIDDDDDFEGFINPALPSLDQRDKLPKFLDHIQEWQGHMESIHWKVTGKKKFDEVNSLPPPNILSLHSGRGNSSGRGAQVSTVITGVKEKYKSLQMHSDFKFTIDSNKTIEEKQKQIRNMLSFPGHSFIVILNDKVDEDTGAYNCALCYLYSHRTGLHEMIQHCETKEHLLKVMELVNPEYADLNSKRATSNKIAAALKDKTGELDKDGVSFATLSSFFSVQKKIRKRIATLRKELANTPVKDNESWLETIPKISSLSGQSPKGTSPCSSSTGLKYSERNSGNNVCSIDAKDSSVKEEKISQVFLKRKSFSNEIPSQNPAKKICTHSEKIFSADTGANNETEIKDPKDTIETPKLKAGLEQHMVSLVQSESSKTAVKVITAKSESDNSRETKEGNKKITKIVWNEEEMSTARSDSDKSSEVIKPKIKKIVWDEKENPTPNADSDKSRESKNAKQKLKKIVWNKKEVAAADSLSSETGNRKTEIDELVSKYDDFKEKDSNDDLTLGLKNLSDLEKEVYKSYKEEINQLVELHRNRRPKKVIIVTDERDVFKPNFIKHKIIRDMNLTFENLKEYLVDDPDFGSGVLFVILCGINSINKERINLTCLNNWCPTPFKFLGETNHYTNLIKKAINVHQVILKLTNNDTAIFSGLIPSSPEIFNRLSFEQRICYMVHESFPFPLSIKAFNMRKLLLYSAFAKLHSKLLGFPPLNLEDNFFENLPKNEKLYNSSALINGYHFNNKFAFKRTWTLLRKCNLLTKKVFTVYKS